MGIHETIQNLVTSDDVVLFMKGDRRSPGCGFSAKVVACLDNLLDDYVAVNVLASPELREGIKAYSDWPTIPQLFVKGQFIGGCDIVTQMQQSGELNSLLGVPDEPVQAPSVTVTPAALKALKDAGAEVARLEIDAQFRPDLSIDNIKPADLQIATEGVTLVLDPRSARRADGVRIDFIAGDRGGFKVENPNEPPRVRPLAPGELQARMGEGTLQLFDVRTPEEQELAQLPGARLLNDDADAFIQTLAKETPLYFLCHHGIRSRGAAEHYLRQGFKTVYNVEGGIDAWSQTVDSSVPRY